MIRVIPPAAVVVGPAPAYAYAGPLAPLAAGRPSSRETRRDSAARRTAAVAIAGSLSRRLFGALGDLGAIMLIVYAVPFVILAVGLPIALLVRLALWIAGIPI